MAKVTKKLQVTIPKELADRCGIKPGDDVQFDESGDGLRVTPTQARTALTLEQRLELFDRATERQRQRQRSRGTPPPSKDRGWTRADLYRRGRSR